MMEKGENFAILIAGVIWICAMFIASYTVKLSHKNVLLAIVFFAISIVIISIILIVIAFYPDYGKNKPKKGCD